MATKNNTNKYVKKAYKKIRKSKYFPLIIVIAVILFAVYIFIPEKEKTLTTSQTTDISKIKNLNYEIPLSPYKEQVVKHKAYTLGYNEDKEQANWVAYKLEKDKLLSPVTERDGDFIEDKSVRTQSATLDDYRSSGYDRGHLAPAADFKWDTTAMRESFYMSNMSPQVPAFNRGIWADLESIVRKNAVENGTLYVVTGPVFNKGESYKTIGKSKVGVPHSYYKALLVINDKEQKAIGFLLPNKDVGGSLSSYAMSIDKLEEITGLDFFYLLDDNVEREIESKFDAKKWSFAKFYSPSVNSDGKQSTNDNKSFTFSDIKILDNLKSVKRTIRSLLRLNK